MATKADWQQQTGKTWAENFVLTDRAFSNLTPALLEAFADIPCQSILDLGCGAGELSIAVAHSRPLATVIGLDISAELIAAAKTRGSTLSNLEFVVGDGAAWQMDCFSPDLVVSRHGVMFFDNPVGAFTHLSKMAAARAKLVFSCFRKPQLNSWASETGRLLQLPPPDDPFAPGPFAFADQARVQGILSESGWQEINFAPIDFEFVIGGGVDPVADALNFLVTIGPAARALAEMSDAQKDAAYRKLREWVSVLPNSDGRLSLPSAAWIVTARNSS